MECAALNVMLETLMVSTSLLMSHLLVTEHFMLCATLDQNYSRFYGACFMYAITLVAFTFCNWVFVTLRRLLAAVRESGLRDV